MGGLDWMDWISPGGGMYRAPYGANNLRYEHDSQRAENLSVRNEDEESLEK